MIYLAQEGRGIGLANKIAAYALQVYDVAPMQYKANYHRDTINSTTVVFLGIFFIGVPILFFYLRHLCAIVLIALF